MNTNFLIKRLQSGENVTIRPSGNSMTPRIKHKQKITIEPIGSNNPDINDVVLCKVKGRFFIHLVTGLKEDQWQISNNHGHVNGWTTRDKIFGKVIKIE